MYDKICTTFFSCNYVFDRKNTTQISNLFVLSLKPLVFNADFPAIFFVVPGLRKVVLVGDQSVGKTALVMSLEARVCWFFRSGGQRDFGTVGSNVL